MATDDIPTFNVVSMTEQSATEIETANEKPGIAIGDTGLSSCGWLQDLPRAERKITRPLHARAARTSERLQERDERRALVGPRIAHSLPRTRRLAAVPEHRFE